MIGSNLQSTDMREQNDNDGFAYLFYYDWFGGGFIYGPFGLRGKEGE